MSIQHRLSSGVPIKYQEQARCAGGGALVVSAAWQTRRPLRNLHWGVGVGVASGARGPLGESDSHPPLEVPGLCKVAGLYRVEGPGLYNVYMDSIPSAEFRKRYASLAEPTVVTANGRRLGTWLPGDAGAEQEPLEVVDRIRALEAEVRHLKGELAKRAPALTPSLGVPQEHPAVGARKAAQAKRDAILRRVNRAN
jgi:hypothetical protein